MFAFYWVPTIMNRLSRSLGLKVKICGRKGHFSPWLLLRCEGKKGEDWEDWEESQDN